jgi:putative ABC transport system permease protein
MTTLWQDVRYGMRMLWKSPGLAGAAVLCLGLGIGAITTIFSVVNGALLRPFPYKKPDRLAVLWEEKSQEPIYAAAKQISPPNFLDCKDSSRAFGDMALVTAASEAMRYRDKLESVRTLQATSNLLGLLGIKPALGRGFLPEEDEKGHQQVMILTHECWQTWFQKDPDVIGKSVILRSSFDGQGERSYSIVGVLPPEFLQPVYPTPKADVLVPLEFSRDDRYRGVPRQKAIGRLREGVTLREARAELDLITRRLREAHPKENEGFRLTAASLRWEYCGEEAGRVLHLLLGAAGLLLVVACVNVADLLLIRGLQRGKEITIRATLGAGRLRVLRQLVMEGLLVALLGLAAGVLISVWGLGALRPLILSYVHVIGGIDLDLRVLAFAAVVALVTGVAFGLIPALAAWRTDLSAALKGDSTQATTSVRTRRVHGLLVTGQMALAFLLLVGAGLAVRTFLNLLRIDPGFNPHHVLAMTVEPPRYDGSRAVAFPHEVVSRVAQLPGVVAAAVSSEALPLWFPGGYLILDMEGRPTASSEGDRVNASYVSAGYFRTLGVPLLTGRDFGEADLNQPVAVINRTLAQRFWPSGNPLGQQLKTKGRDESYEIVGVVEDERYWPEQWTGKVEIAPRAYLNRYEPGYLNLMIRTASNPLELGPVVRALVKELDDRVLVRWVRSMDEDVHEVFRPPQLTMLLVGVFAVFAFALTIVGLYGVMAHSARSRYREIAIRIATGARPADILRMILRQGAMVVAVGMGVGLAGVFALARVAASYVYGVAPMDGLTLAGAVLLLGAASGVACGLPARRAARIDPMAALRYE